MSKAFFNIISSLVIAFVGLSVFAAGGNLIQNGGFEDTTLIWGNNGNYGSNGGEARTAAWTGGQLCKQNTVLAPPSGFMDGTYCAYLWGASSISQDFVFPVDGTCRVEFKAVQRSGQNTPHPIKVILTRLDTGVAVTNEFTVNSKVAEGDSYQHDFENVVAGLYKLTILGTNISGASCYEGVSVTAVSGSPFAGVSFVQDSGTRVSLNVRSFGDSGDEAIAVDYALSENGTTWSEWMSVSSSLAKDASVLAVVERLQLETAYWLKLRLSASGNEQVVVIPFTTSKELLRNRSFEENTITTLSTAATVPAAAPWQGNGSVAQKGYTGLAPKDATVTSGGFHAYFWCYFYIAQDIYVPVAGTYRLKFKYVLRSGNSRHDFDIAMITSDATNIIDSVVNQTTSATEYSKAFTIDSTGPMTFRLKGAPTSSSTYTDGTTFFDNFSLELVEKASINPSASTSVDTSAITYDRVTINNSLLSTGGSATDIYFAYGPTNGALSAYELIRSNVTEACAFSHTISNLEIATGYQYAYRFENTAGGATTNTGTFVTGKNIFRNGSFENGSSISNASASPKDSYGDIGGTAQTEAWSKGSMAKSDCGTFYPSSSFAVGNFFGYIWWGGTLEQDFEVPVYGVYKLSFRYGLRNMDYTAGTSVKTTVSFVRKGVTNEKTWSTDVNSKDTTFTPDTDDLKFTLKAGTTHFILSQVRNDSNNTSACYDDFKLELVERLKQMGTMFIVR